MGKRATYLEWPARAVYLAHCRVGLGNEID
jgi:hypothetical protein